MLYLAWSAAITFALLNIAGSDCCHCHWQWYLKQIYRYGYFPIAGTSGFSARSENFLGVMSSTKAKGTSAAILRYCLGDVHRAACVVVMCSRTQHARRQFGKLAVFVESWFRWQSPVWGGCRERDHRSRRVGGCGLRRIPRCPFANWHCHSIANLSIGNRQSIRHRQSKICNATRLEGLDDYAPFYDWENAQTLDRRDVLFWRGWPGAAGRVLSSAWDWTRHHSGREVGARIAARSLVAMPRRH